MSTKYDLIVRKFVEERNGYFIILGDNPSFYKMLRGTLYKILAIRGDCLSGFQDQSPALKELKDKLGAKAPVVLLVDRLLKGRPTADFVSNVKRIFPEVKQVVLTEEIAEEQLIFLHELGVDNIITMPVSVDHLIQKLAFTIQPQGKLNQLIQLGKECVIKGELETVLKISNKILELKEGSPAGLMLLGDALSGLGRRDDAFKAYNEAHQQSKVFMEPIKKLANLYKDNDQEKYLKYLEKLDNISPLNTDRKRELGRVYLDQDDVAKAEKYFDEAIKCAVREAHQYLGNIVTQIAESFFESDPSKAEKYYAKLLHIKSSHLSKDDLETFNRLGISLRKQGKWRQAIENYKSALRVAPREAGLYYNIGLAYTDGEDFAKCAQYFKMAMNCNSDIHRSAPSVARNIAGVYIRQGFKEEARILLGEALTVFKDDARLKAMLKKVAK